MFRLFLFIILSFLFLNATSQNDLDAIRYSRLGPGGGARFLSMGGAFGALGADLGCGSTNPAGLGLYKKGDVAYSFGIKFTHDKSVINRSAATVDDARIVFNNFGGAFTWQARNDKESRHVLAYSNNQLMNFSEKVHMASYTNSATLAQDMLNIANQKLASHDSLDNFYEGAAWNVYLMDKTNSKYVSLVDLKRTMLQTRDIVTSGRVNDINFSYAYSMKDKIYFGVSLGLPKVTYTSTTTHVEKDDKDSMQINWHVTMNPPNPNDTTYTTTYLAPPDSLHIGDYFNKGGFNSLTWTEYFRTTGTGLNLKLGGVYRINDMFRVGFFAHTPTIYTMHDVYYNDMQATFDANKKDVLEWKYPDQGGTFDYQIITPGKIGTSVGVVIKKYAAIGLDYELVNYAKAQLSSANPSDFAGVNAIIKHKYKYGSNLRLGGELNLKPVFLRAGYNMQGSPFGNAFGGTFVRHIISLGIGTRIQNFSLDLSWYKYLSTEDYFMFTTITQKSKIYYNGSMLTLTAGIKF